MKEQFQFRKASDVPGPDVIEVVVCGYSRETACELALIEMGESHKGYVLVLNPLTPKQIYNVIGEEPYDDPFWSAVDRAVDDAKVEETRQYWQERSELFQ